MMKQTDKAITEASYISAVGVLKNKLENTNGKDWCMWCGALSEVRNYWHKLNTGEALAEAMQSEAKAMYQRAEEAKAKGIPFEDCFSKHELVVFCSRYSIALIENAEELEELAKGIPYKVVLRKRFEKDAEDKRHLRERIEREATKAHKAHDALTAYSMGINSGMGLELMHDAVVVFSAIARVCERYNIPVTTESMMDNCKYAFKAVNASIYAEKKTQSAKATEETKLGTKATRTATDTTASKALSNVTIEELKETIAKSTLRQSTKEAYTVLLMAIIEGQYSDTGYIAELLATTPQSLCNIKKRFIEWLGDNAKASVF